MANIKQSFCYSCFHREGLDVAKFFKEVKKIGFAAVETWDRTDEPVPFDDLVKMATDAGLAISNTNGQLGSLRKGLNNPENHSRIADQIAQSIEVAAKLKIPGLTCFSGNRDGRDDEKSIDVCAQGISKVIKLAEQKGVNLNMELLNSKRNHPDYQCDHVAWGVKLCKAVNSPRMKLLYDIYHMQIMDGDIIATIRENIQYIGHFHTAGNPGRGLMDASQELNYAAICKAIADTGYSNYVAHEFFVEGKDPVELLRAAYSFCNV